MNVHFLLICTHWTTSDIVCVCVCVCVCVFLYCGHTYWNKWSFPIVCVMSFVFANLYYHDSVCTLAIGTSLLFMTSQH